MKRAIVIAASIAFALAAHAADCPKPPPLTCEQLRAKLVQRCEPQPQATPCPTAAPCPACPPPPACPPLAAPTMLEVRVPFQVEVPVPAQPRGHWLLGGGPMYFHGVGATLVGGYEFKNRVMLLAGPTWIPQNDVPAYEGIARKGCVRIPYTAPGHEADKPLGAQAIVVFAFGR